MRHYFFSYTKRKQYILLAGDFLVIVFSIFISYLIKDIINREPHILLVMQLRIDFRLLLVPAINLFTLYILDLYNLNRIVDPIVSSVTSSLSVMLASVFVGGVFFFFPKYVLGRQVLLIYTAVLILILIMWRIFVCRIIVSRARPKRMALLGNGNIVPSIIEELANIPNNILEVNQVCIIDNTEYDRCKLTETMIEYESVLDLLRQGVFDVLAFESDSHHFTDDEIRKILELKFKGKAIYDISELYENITAKVPINYISGRWLLNRNGLQGELNRTYLRAKRFLDIVLSSVILVLAAPLFLMIIISIRVDSKGKAFFSQERLGLQRKPFRCIKFRTMVENAESISGPTWSSEGDPRITRVGRFLRKTRLDELPQLWNILKGEMSFVGPRPIREHFADLLEDKIPFYGLRFSIKPGLTGWAQVQHDYAGSEEGQLIKFQYELFYIQNMSPFLDVFTIIKTVQKVLWGGGGI
jgi:exopolysaccharide biosynthesis polyprenyl glycosylphosphotransferase